KPNPSRLRDPRQSRTTPLTHAGCGAAVTLWDRSSAARSAQRKWCQPPPMAANATNIAVQQIAGFRSVSKAIGANASTNLIHVLVSHGSAKRSSMMPRARAATTGTIGAIAKLSRLRAVPLMCDGATQVESGQVDPGIALDGRIRDPDESERS